MCFPDVHDFTPICKSVGKIRLPAHDFKRLHTGADFSALVLNPPSSAQTLVQN